MMRRATLHQLRDSITRYDTRSINFVDFSTSLLDKPLFLCFSNSYSCNPQHYYCNTISTHTTLDSVMTFSFSDRRGGVCAIWGRLPSSVLFIPQVMNRIFSSYTLFIYFSWDDLIS